ncbi:MAG: hypothetical protein R8N50_02335 [Alphaproteobacteria bacterium]|nr:hypothetical protein [Alphaproteobacteria bacterium]
MKKLMKKLNFAIIGVMVSAPAMAVSSNITDAVCKLSEQFGEIFSVIRLLAFVGAGVTIAGWAWGYISAGKIEVVKEVKEKGIAMLIGFILLFGIGTLVSVFMAMTGEGGYFECVANFFD